jgi:hypothetical protein
LRENKVYFLYISIFLIREIALIGKMKEQDILVAIRRGGLSLSPIEFRDMREAADATMDALLQARCNGHEWTFAVEVKARSTPKALHEAVQAIQASASPPQTYPLVVVPFLNADQIDELAALNVSAVDLSGNGVLVVPGEILVLRTGMPNRYPEKSVLKNVYRGKSSLAARVFLLRSEYEAVGEIRDEILSRDGEIALSTVSKVLARLEDDLIISREPGHIRLIQPQKLLDALVKQYESPDVISGITGRTILDVSDFATRLDDTAQRIGARIAPTGLTSTSTYAVMARSGPASFYCSDARALTSDPELGRDFDETERFGNIRLLECQDDTVYFDLRRDQEGLAASPIQTYLELMSGDKRDRETAEQVAANLLKSVEVQRA